MEKVFKIHGRPRSPDVQYRLRFTKNVYDRAQIEIRIIDIGSEKQMSNLFNWKLWGSRDKKLLIAIELVQRKLKIRSMSPEIPRIILGDEHGVAPYQTVDKKAVATEHPDRVLQGTPESEAVP